ncbi:MAG: hypothetical protein M3463_12215 [Verrucomicrobiota bacterium]|nr:hypothetical protein [Verrucomicrobiota bacterium]
MKTISLSFFACTALIISATAQVPVGPGSMKLGKVEAAFTSTPEYQITGGQSKRSRLGKWLEMEISYETAPDEIDELTFRYTVLVEKKLLTGEVTYANILKGRDHYAVMYISPKGLDRLLGGKAISAGSVENVWVEVSRQGQVLARESLKPGAVPNLPQVAGLVLSKDHTPFAPLYYDRYESIKAAR